MQTATCHTEGCENAEIPISLDFIPEGELVESVWCGACNNPITDLVGTPTVLEA